MTRLGLGSGVPASFTRVGSARSDLSWGYLDWQCIFFGCDRLTSLSRPEQGVGATGASEHRWPGGLATTFRPC